MTAKIGNVLARIGTGVKDFRVIAPAVTEAEKTEAIVTITGITVTKETAVAFAVFSVDALDNQTNLSIVGRGYLLLLLIIQTKRTLFTSVLLSYMK